MNIMVDEKEKEKEKPEEIQTTLKRPQFIGQLIDANIEIQQENAQYKSFLRMAQEAKDECYYKKLPIESSFKIQGAPINFKQEYNDTLLVVFAFYAKMDQSQVAQTFETRDFFNSTVSFKELVIFAKDFKVIPKLLAIDDLKLLWDMKAAEYEREGKRAFNVCKVEEFKDMLVRMALFTYHKPGLKKMIITVDGFVPKNSKVVNNFCTYLQLHDIDAIHSFMRKVVAKNENDKDFMLIATRNGKEWHDIMKDREGKKYSQIDYAAQTMPDMMKSTVSTLAVNRGSKKRAAFPINAFGEKLHEPIVIDKANPFRVVSHDPDYDPNEGHKNDHLPGDFFRTKRGGGGGRKSKKESGDGENEGEGEEEEEEEEEDDDFGNLALNESAASPDLDSPDSKPFRSRNHRKKEALDEMVATFDIMSVTTSTLDVFYDTSLSSLRRTFYNEYYHGLVRELDKYSYIPPRVYSTDLIKTDGPFIDLGLLREGDEITILMNITNASDDVLDVITTAVDFEAEDTNITSFNRPIVPGLTRQLNIFFTVEAGKKNQLAQVNVVAKGARGREDIILECPVYYRVDPLIKSTSICNCTIGSLESLLRKHCPEDFEEELRQLQGANDGHRILQPPKTKLGMITDKKQETGLWNTKASTMKRNNDSKLSATYTYNRYS